MAMKNGDLVGQGIGWRPLVLQEFGTQFANVVLCRTQVGHVDVVKPLACDFYSYNRPGLNAELKLFLQLTGNGNI
jgi:hypothetical protein